MTRDVVLKSRRLVVKVGTRVVTCADGTLDDDRIAQLADGVIHWCEAGRQVVVVSSGAVGAGVGLLGLPARPSDLARLQAVAAVGQTRLIETYDRTFRHRGRNAAQVLLTADDLRRRTGYLNIRNTLLTLLEMRTIPVINENDTVAVDELQTAFGDNDRLSAMVANLLGAPLVILSDVDGLMNGDPQRSESRVVSLVERDSPELDALVVDRASGLSKGGMASKLAAARLVVASGNFALIAGGRRDRVLQRILAQEELGTLFLPSLKPVPGRKRWIGFGSTPKGLLRLDDGACRAICQQGRSLLAIGITAVEQDFGKGDAVSLSDAQGREIARGLTNYRAEELRTIRGQRSDRIAELLGHCPYEEVIHRDNLTVLRDA